MVDDITASGRFVLRIPPTLHAALRRSAAEAGLSLNEYSRRVLEGRRSGLVAGVEADAGAVVRRAEDLCGGGLVGVVVYGSWARGAAAAGSDVDVLVAVSPGYAVTRELYRRWDAAGALAWDGHRVEAHFAHVPASGVPVTATWAEAAVDGVVVHDPGFRLTQRLVEVRGRIVAGELRRHWSHGQPYWVGAA